MKYDLGESLLRPTSSFPLPLPANLNFSFFAIISSFGSFQIPTGEELIIWTKDLSQGAMRERVRERWSQGTIILIVFQAERDFPNLTMKWVVGATKLDTCAGIMQPVVWGPWILECLVSSVAGRLDILDPKESLGVLWILWVFVDLVQTSYTMPALLEVSVKSWSHPSTRLLSDFTAHTKNQIH